MDEGRVSEAVHYSASAEIFMGDGAPTTGSFNAEDTITRLSSSIIRPPA